MVEMQEDFANLFPRAFCSQVSEKALRTRLRLCEKAREAFSLGSISAALSCQVVHEKQLVIEPTFSFASLRQFYFSNSGTESSKCSLFFWKKKMQMHLKMQVRDFQGRVVQDPIKLTQG